MRIHSLSFIQFLLNMYPNLIHSARQCIRIPPEQSRTLIAPRQRPRWYFPYVVDIVFILVYLNIETSLSAKLKLPSVA